MPANRRSVAAFNSGQLERASSYIDQALAALAAVGTRPWVPRLVSHLGFHRGSDRVLRRSDRHAPSGFSRRRSRRSEPWPWRAA